MIQALNLFIHKLNNFDYESILESGIILNKKKIYYGERTIDIILNAIVLISMSLCFFGLSSSMSSNIFDQSKEISVMRSFGVQKY